MKIYKHTICDTYTEEDELDYISCMSNVRGYKIVNPGKQNFSFYFSEKYSFHGIMVKFIFNPIRISNDNFGTLVLHGKYDYKLSSDDKHVSEKEINKMVSFFKTYKVLFAAVWEGELYDVALTNYFLGLINFNELLCEFDEYDLRYDDLKNIHNVQELEKYVRKSKWFNMND